MELHDPDKATEAARRPTKAQALRRPPHVAPMADTRGGELQLERLDLEDVDAQERKP